MNKEKFLTVGWNNILTLAMGIPTGIFIYWAFASGASSTLGGMIGISIIGGLY